MTERAAFSPSSAQRGVRKGPALLSSPALHAPRSGTGSRGLVRGPGQARPRQLPLHRSARQGHIQTQARSCTPRYLGAASRQDEQPGWLTLRTCARLCWELSFRPTTPKGPGPGQGPVLTPPLLSGLTLREAWRVVIDIGDYDGDCGGSRQATQLSCHVRCTDHHLVPVLRLTVQVSHGRPDHTWKPAGQREHRQVAEHPSTESQMGQGWKEPLEITLSEPQL